LGGAGKDNGGMVLFCGGLGWFFELEINQRREGVLTCWEDVARGAGSWRSYVGEEKTKGKKLGGSSTRGFSPVCFCKREGEGVFWVLLLQGKWRAKLLLVLD